MRAQEDHRRPAPPRNPRWDTHVNQSDQLDLFDAMNLPNLPSDDRCCYFCLTITIAYAIN